MSKARCHLFTIENFPEETQFIMLQGVGMVYLVVLQC